MLPARVQAQASRVSNENLDVVTGTEGPQWDAGRLRYGTVAKPTTVDGSEASDAHALTVGAVIGRVRQAWWRIVN